jgi:response regulator RpfG family c-di-GMP phosphodiesterase
MAPNPTTTITNDVYSLKNEVSSLKKKLKTEQDARIEAETSLLMVDMAQENGDPPPSRMAMITGLAKLSESRDDATGKHLSRIRKYTEIISQAYSESHPNKLPLGEVSIIAAASMLHDIGKVGISDDVLLHPNKFTEKQFEKMKQHTTIGADILLSLSEELGSDPWIDTAIQISLGHHEKWDGSGYPYQLSENRINLPSRLVAVADVYDALTTKRVYKESMTHEKAVSIIKKESGKHFDPEVVKAFLSKTNEIEIAKESY